MKINFQVTDYMMLANWNGRCRKLLPAAWS